MDTSEFLIITTIICIIDGQEWEIESDTNHILEQLYQVQNTNIEHLMML